MWKPTHFGSHICTRGKRIGRYGICFQECLIFRIETESIVHLTVQS